MPVLVVGADHPLGQAIAHRLAGPGREVRAFVSEPASVPGLRRAGVKVAVGDLSDDSHVAAAAADCFGIVFVEPALSDGRELAFASVERAAAGWARAAGEAGVTRVIWVGESLPSLNVREPVLVAIGFRTEPAIVDEVVAEEDRPPLGPRGTGPRAPGL